MARLSPDSTEPVQRLRRNPKPKRCADFWSRLAAGTTAPVILAENPRKWGKIHHTMLAPPSSTSYRQYSPLCGIRLSPHLAPYDVSGCDESRLYACGPWGQAPLHDLPVSNSPALYNKGFASPEVFHRGACPLRAEDNTTEVGEQLVARTWRLSSVRVLRLPGCHDKARSAARILAHGVQSLPRATPFLAPAGAQESSRG